jgi:carbohydrate kinase (thermoresistant glucokinase family)
MSAKNGSSIEATESAATRAVPPMVLVLMGVSGSGKSTVALELHRVLGWPFQEGDDLHPLSNVEKMRCGRSFDDADRLPWLRAVAHWIDERLVAHEPGIITCSNLKRAYRQITIGSRQGVRLVFLKGDEHVIRARIVQRQHRYMPPTLLRSQFETLEEPGEDEHPVVVTVRGSIAETVTELLLRVAPEIRHLPNGGPM